MLLEKLIKLFLLITFILFISCSSKEQPSINLEGEGCEYCIEAETCEIILNKFIANENWYAYVKYQNDKGWIDLSETEGGSGMFALKVFVKTNEGSSTRRATVVVKSGMYKIEYHVEQLGKEENPNIPEEPEVPIDPEPSEPGEGTEESSYSMISKISVRKYNDSFQLIGEEMYEFTYKDGKIVEVREFDKNGHETVNAEYFQNKLVLKDRVSIESDINEGYLTTIESTPVTYINKGISVGEWKVYLSDFGVEKVSNSQKEILLTYNGGFSYPNSSNIDLSALVCVSLIRDVLVKDFIYSQKVLYKLSASNHLYFQKAKIGEDLYLYDYRLDNGKVVRIDEYFQPKYVQNWLKRSIEIIYM